MRYEVKEMMLTPGRFKVWDRKAIASVAMDLDRETAEFEAKRRNDLERPMSAHPALAMPYGQGEDQ